MCSVKGVGYKSIKGFLEASRKKRSSGAGVALLAVLSPVPLPRYKRIGHQEKCKIPGVSIP
jgi:hypothetical protein